MEKSFYDTSLCLRAIDPNKRDPGSIHPNSTSSCALVMRCNVLMQRIRQGRGGVPERRPCPSLPLFGSSARSAPPPSAYALLMWCLVLTQCMVHAETPINLRDILPAALFPKT
eukprot:2890515-Rhodomonas_salina.1